MKTRLALLLILAAISTMAIGQQPLQFGQSRETRTASAAASPPVLHGCVVSLIYEAQFPGQEPGVLLELNAKEGQEVKEGDLLGKTDDTQPYMQGRIAMEEHKAAVEKANNDVDVRYAEKATELAATEYEKSKAANDKTPGAVSDIELRRLYLTYQRGGLETERAKSERKVAAFTAAAKAVEIEAAKEAMERHEIRAPANGVIAQVHLHKGEWVKPGDPVLHLMQLDRLRVEGYVDLAKFSPSQVLNRPVTVQAMLQGRKVEFTGKITFVSPLVEGVDSATSSYRVKAEVENLREDGPNGQWLLQPGMIVDMSIRANEPRVANSR
jgi:multidrug resistance efflux pump